MDKQVKKFTQQMKEIGLNVEELEKPEEVGILALLDPDFPKLPDEKSETTVGKNTCDDGRKSERKSKCPNPKRKNNETEKDEKEKYPNMKRRRIETEKGASTRCKSEGVTGENVNRGQKKENKKTTHENKNEQIVKLMDELVEKEEEVSSVSQEITAIHKKMSQFFSTGDGQIRNWIEHCGNLQDIKIKLELDITDLKNNLDLVLIDSKYDFVRKSFKGDKVTRVKLEKVDINGKKMFKCAYCHFTKPSTGSVEMHMVDEHGYAHFHCSFCNFSTKNSRSLYLHTKLQHNYNNGVCSR